MASNESNSKTFAAEAVARLYSGEMTDAEERNIESWLQADPQHRADYQKMLDVWDAAGNVGGTTEQEARSGWFGNRLLLGVAASLLALTVVPLLMFYTSGPGSELRRYETGVGEIREIALVDGSQVTLNTNTQVLVDISETQRRIILDHGEAFFDIAKDPSRPLTVSAGDRVITVLGTSFNVNWDGRDVTVAVIEGQVAVQAEGAEETAVEHLIRLNNASGSSPGSMALQQGVVLEAGDVAQISRTAEPVIEAVSGNTDRYQSWRFGYIRFDDEPLSIVIKELNRYSSTRLSVESPDIANMKVSGVFRTSDIDNTISGLELIFPIKVLDRGDHMLIVSANDR